MPVPTATSAAVPQYTSHLLMKRDPSGKVDKLEHGVHIVRLPGHHLSVIRIGSRSTHGECGFGAGEGGQ